MVMIAAAAALAWQTRTLAGSQMERLAEDNNANLTQAFANAVWKRFSAFIASAHMQSPDSLRADPRTEDLRQAIGGLMANTDVVRVKLYDLEGLVVFSTDPEQIGQSAEERDRFSAAAAGKIASELEFEERIADMAGPRQDIWVLSSYVPVRDAASGAVEGVVEVYHDVTAFHLALQRLERLQIAIIALVVAAVFGVLLGFVWRADRLIRREHERNLELAAGVARAEAASQAKTEFLANMSHELRTPLNAIIGFSTLIRDQTLGSAATAKYREFAADICASGQHLLNVINDVLDMAKLEVGHLPINSEPCDVAAILREVVKITRPSAEAKQISLNLEADPALAPIHSDATKIRQIAFNLLSNAIKFTPAGGKVSAALHHAPDGQTMTFSVSDNGIGMKSQDVTIALMPFGQVDSGLNRKFEGAGLGLPLSKRYAEALGGSLAIQSTPGVGTIVTVTLPGPSMQPRSR
jgi:signal transduction histidine kinase